MELTVSVTDKNGTVIYTCDVEIEDPGEGPGMDTANGRAAVLEAAGHINDGTD